MIQPEPKPFEVNRRKFPLVSHSAHCDGPAFTGINSKDSIHFRRARSESAWSLENEIL